MEQRILDEKRKEKREQLKKAAEPLVKLINEEYHPHVTVIVTPTSVEVLEGVSHIEITDFIVD